MARLPTSVNFPRITELLDGRATPQEFWGTYISAVQYWIQRLIRRTNDELIENFGTQTVDLELVLSGTNGKLGINATTRLNKIMSLSTALDFPSIPSSGQAEVTVTFTGVVVAKTEAVANPGAPTGGGSADLETGLAIGAVWVSAANTVKIRLFNHTLAAIDPVDRTWRISARVYD